ncbi:GAF domain-containing protein [Aureibacter tunicatorum]|uniref:Competence protein ComGC n=1 Tax=Aureibacter tunicatorum TaxID=866807 RepID=A0AAE3XKI8_9BACT|nr:GAF domain-containing protein [Aureibacter tunicatorum]MDR6238205.1 competence protein ComGC [Aureibacter tunicatorum]BDD03238.1 hypothetical protein AUTU_07210 [Aureibacter tunicatorum]
MKFINKIYNLGVSEEMDDQDKFKYKFSNFIAGLMVVFSFLYTILLYFKGAELYKPIILELAFLSILLLNHYNKINISRAILAGFSPVMLFWGHLGILYEDESPAVGFVILQLVCCILPWTVFNVKEYGKTILFTLWGTGLMMATFFVGGMSPMPQPEKVAFFQSPLSIVIGIFFVLLISFMLKYITYVSDNHNQSLLNEVGKQNEEIELRHEETKKYLEELEEKQGQENERQWVNDGINSIVHMLQSQQDAGELLYDQIMNNVTNYLEANQGAFYLVEENDEGGIVLNLKASYAYSRKKYIEKEVLAGEGLLGQTYFEKKTLYLTEVPENYVNITSGLGQALPRAIIIEPCLQNKKVVAVMEFASFNEIEEKKREYLKAISEIIASFINNYEMNLQTQRLLEESQNHADEMRAQEEELRQNLEEMQSLQDEMNSRMQSFEVAMKEKDEEIRRLKAS